MYKGLMAAAFITSCSASAVPERQADNQIQVESPIARLEGELAEAETPEAVRDFANLRNCVDAAGVQRKALAQLSEDLAAGISLTTQERFERQAVRNKRLIALACHDLDPENPEILAAEAALREAQDELNERLRRFIK